jgi:hypothetical protein
MTPVDFSAYPKRLHAPRPIATMLRLTEVMPNLPPAPRSVDWYAKAEAAGPWGMLGNDTYGCCAPAAMLHWLMARTCYAGIPFIPVTDDCLRLYSCSTNPPFDPTDPATDMGTNGADMMNYCLRNSMIQERDDRLLLALPLNPSNMEELRQAIDLCCGIGVGQRFPEAWNTSRDWDATSSPVEGRHFTYLPGYDRTASGSTVFQVITWGERVQQTQAGAEQFIDEAWAVCDLDFIDATGKDPQGLLRAEYQRRVAALPAG